MCSHTIACTHPHAHTGIDRHLLAKDLGFDGVIPNSLDAVGDRDFILDFLFGSSMIMLHMSRFAEDLVRSVSICTFVPVKQVKLSTCRLQILYSSTEFGFVKLADAYSTGIYTHTYTHTCI
jgi:argininosuccinate lyase